MIAPDNFPPFHPHPLVANAYVMTFAGSLHRREPPALQQSGVERVFHTTGDNAVLARCHWHEDRDRPVMLLIHGLIGDLDSGYVIGTAEKAWARGFHVIRVNARSCGGTEELAADSYHGGLTEDVEAVAREVVAQDGVSRVYLVGYSLGGNMALKLAGELGEESPSWLAGTATMSPCLDLELSSATLGKSLFGRLCERRFLRELGLIVRRRKRLRDPALDIQGLESIRTLRAFDDRYTGPMGGFVDADDYYRQASAISFLPQVRVPSLLLAARDDPLVPFSTFERPEITRNPAVTVIATDRGGHTAHIGRSCSEHMGFVDTDRRWAENRLVQYCLLLEHQRGALESPW